MAVRVSEVTHSLLELVAALPVVRSFQLQV